MYGLFKLFFIRSFVGCFHRARPSICHPAFKKPMQNYYNFFTYATKCDYLARFLMKSGVYTLKCKYRDENRGNPISSQQIK